jgi:hypothetical protein
LRSDDLRGGGCNMWIGPGRLRRDAHVRDVHGAPDMRWRRDSQQVRRCEPVHADDLRG